MKFQLLLKILSPPPLIRFQAPLILLPQAWGFESCPRIPIFWPIMSFFARYFSKIHDALLVPLGFILYHTIQGLIKMVLAYPASFSYCNQGIVFVDRSILIEFRFQWKIAVGYLAY